MRLIKDIWQVLDHRSKIIVIFLQLFLICSSILETLSIVVLAPFMGMITGDFKIQDNKIIQYIYNYIDVGLDQFIFYFGIFVLIFFLISNLINIFSVYYINFFSNRIGAKISSRLYNSYILRPYEFHIENNSADIVSKVSFDSDRAYTLIKRALQSGADTLKCLFIIFALILYNFKVAIILSLIFFCIYTFIFLLLEKKVKLNGKILSENNSYILKLIQDGLGSIKDIIIFKKYKFFTYNFLKYRINFSNLTAFNQTSAMVPRNIIEMVAFSLIIILILLYLNNNYFLDNSISLLAVFGLASYKLLPSFQNIYFNLSVIKSTQDSFYKIRNELKENIDKNQSYKNFKKLSFQKSLKLENIYWTYKTSEKKILDNINITIQPNDIIGIAGKSGSGKTTLGNIILGLLKPKKGKLIIDDIEIDEKNVNNWQKNISFVPQNIFLMDGTIKENITFGEEADLFSQKKFDMALKMADLDEFVKNSKDGINTIVGERGLALSGGQSQRVGIARAFYYNNDLLFFDEATSSLDGLTENKIISSIRELKNKTLFLISHNFSTIKNCDKIIFLVDGKVEAVGSYFELINNNNKFADLAKVS